jgi:hypothetical protein
MGKWIIAGICAVLALAVLLSLGTQTVFSQEGERGERKHEGLSIDFKDVSVDDAVAFISEKTGLNIILQADMAQHFAKAGTLIDLKLNHVGPRQAIRALAHCLQLRADMDDNMVFFKWVPGPNEAAVIGKLILKEKNFQLELNVYQGEIPAELKQYLVHQLIENNATKMKFEGIKLRKAFGKMEQGGFDGDRAKAIKEKREWLEKEKAKREKGKPKGDAGNQKEQNIF